MLRWQLPTIVGARWCIVACLPAEDAPCVASRCPLFGEDSCPPGIQIPDDGSWLSSANSQLSVRRFARSASRIAGRQLSDQDVSQQLYGRQLCASVTMDPTPSGHVSPDETQRRLNFTRSDTILFGAPGMICLLRARRAMLRAASESIYLILYLH